MVKKKVVKKTIPVTADVIEPQKPAPWVERGSGHQHDWQRAGVLREGEITEFCTICADTRVVS